MHTLYESDAYSLIHVLGTWEEGLAPAARNDAQRRLPRHGFELLDRRSGKEVFLDGPWAELFQRHLETWQRNAPTQDEVEDTLEQYAGLAQIPTTLH